ncbi:MAG: HDOD domain-containing protein [Opitutus sp.]
MIATPIPRETLLHVAKGLPAAPRILAQLGHLLLDPTSDLSELTDLLKRDAALTARIIRISNSAFYNAGHPFASLDEALARVGFTEVYRLTGLAAVAHVADSPLSRYRVSGIELRENSLLTALIAEILAEMTQQDKRAAYTAGLLRSVGKVALDRLTLNGSYEGHYRGKESGRLGDWETSFIGLNNCEAAAMILTEWRFPLQTIEGIRDHYGPPANQPLAQLLNLAAAAAEKGGHGFPGESDYWSAFAETGETLSLTPDDLAEALRRALETFGPVRSAVS